VSRNQQSPTGDCPANARSVSGGPCGRRSLRFARLRASFSRLAKASPRKAKPTPQRLSKAKARGRDAPEPQRGAVRQYPKTCRIFRHSAGAFCRQSHFLLASRVGKMRACFLGQNICSLGFGIATLQAPPLVMDTPIPQDEPQPEPQTEPATGWRRPTVFGPPPVANPPRPVP
jgi:hypothetical protein